MNRKRIISQRIKAQRYLSPVVTILAGTIISFIGFTLALSLDRQMIRTEFEKEAENRFETIKREIESNLHAVVSLKAFFDSIGDVDRFEFRDFVGPHLSVNPSIQAIEWIPYVPHFQRMTHEAAARQKGLSDFQITERETQGNMIRAAEREEYFPVYFVEPYKGNEIALGFDLASNSMRKQALEKSRDTGEMVATGRVTLVQETEGQFGFLVFAPVFRKGVTVDSIKARRENLKGFALGVFRLGDIVEKSLTHLKREGIDIYLNDKSAASQEESFLYFHSSQTGKTPFSSTPNGQASPDGHLENVRTLDIANREWLILMKSTPDFASARKTWQPWEVLISGLLLTAILASYLIVLKGAAEGLRESEEKFRTLVNNAPEAIFVGTRGRFAYVNEAALRLFGATLQEQLLDQPVMDRFHPDFHEAVLERIRLLNEEKIPVSTLEEKYLRLDGTSVDVEVSAVPFSYAQHDGALVFARDITERKRAEEELRAAYAHARSLIEASLDPLVTISADGKITDVNTATEAVTGRDRKDLIGNDFSSYFTEPEKARNGYQQVFREGSVQDYPLEIRHRDGHVTSVLYNASVYRDGSGQVVGMFAAARDITARKKAEDELRRSEHFIQRINDMLPDVLCLFDLVEQRYVYANQQAEPLLGYTPEQMKEMGAAFVQEVVHPEDVHILIELSEQVRTLKDGEIIEKEYRIKHGLSGEYRWLRSLTVVFERTPDGLPRLNLGIARDITPTKIAEENLRAAEWLFREFAENAGAIFWISTPGFDKFLYISPAYERIWQRSCESIIENASSWFESVHPEDSPHVSEVMKTNPEGGCTLEFRIMRPDGSVRWIRNRAFPLGGVNGTVFRMGGIADDITEEKRMQQEAEYRRQQIIHADKLSALGEVVAGVAHEINNPNSFITYNIPLLDQTWKIIEPIVLEYAQAHPEWSGSEPSLDELCQDMRGIIHDIQAGADRINRIVKNLKDFARLEESGHARPVQVNDVIQKTMTIVGAQLRKDAVKITVELAEDLPEVEGHFNKLEQVVANLLVNAAHAVKGKDDGRILVSSRYLERLDAVIVTVEDNGRGITQDIMDRIFDPFFTTRRSTGGTGLGLSVSYGLIEEHKGTIGVLSRPGVGSRFTVFLPVDCNKGLELKPTILYVDDDSVFLELLQMHFIRVHQCAEGLRSSEDVMAYLADHPEVDIVFSDLMMPNVNGWELLAMVKEKFPLLTIVLYSGDLIALKARRENAAPPDYLIEKPFTMKLLAEIISKIGRQRL